MPPVQQLGPDLSSLLNEAFGWNLWICQVARGSAHEKSTHVGDQPIHLPGTQSFLELAEFAENQIAITVVGAGVGDNGLRFMVTIAGHNLIAEDSVLAEHSGAQIKIPVVCDPDLFVESVELVETCPRRQNGGGNEKLAESAKSIEISRRIDGARRGEILIDADIALWLSGGVNRSITENNQIGVGRVAKLFLGGDDESAVEHVVMSQNDEM